MMSNLQDEEALMTAKHKHSTNDNAKEILSTMMRVGIPRHAELNIIDEKPLRTSGNRRVHFDLDDDGVHMKLFSNNSILTDADVFYETTVASGEDETFMESIIMPFEHGYGSSERRWSIGAMDDEGTVLAESYRDNSTTFASPLLVMAAYKEWWSFWSNGTSNEYVPLEILVDAISAELGSDSVTLVRKFQFEGGQYGLVRTGLGCLLIRTEVLDVDGSADYRIWRSSGSVDAIANYLDTDHVGSMGDFHSFSFIDAGGKVYFLKKDMVGRFVKWAMTNLFGNEDGNWRSNELEVHFR